MWDSFLEFKLGSTWKSINTVHYIKRMKEKDHTIISIDADKEVNEIQPPFIRKALSILRIEENLLNILKVIC